MAKKKTLTINTESPKASYSLKGITNIKLVSDHNEFNDGTLASMISDVRIEGKYLYVTMNTDMGPRDLKFTKFSNIQNLTMEYGTYSQPKGALYEYLSSLNATNHPISTYVKTKTTGTVFDDVIDMSTSDYAPQTQKDIDKNKGLTINGGKGNDTMTGTNYNDTFIGGAGKNTIILKNTLFGEDTVKLTKGETLYIETELGVTIRSYRQGLNKKDLLISTTTGSTLIIKNYYAKNTGATVIVDGHDLTKEALLDEVTAGNYFENGDKMKAKYTGSILADNIDASGLSKATKVKKGIEYGVTINGGGGDDVIVGSDFVDTIKGGDGDDTITGGKGNDKLYGEKGLNTFIFNTGDGNDTVYSGKGNDTLNFEDIELSDLEFERGKNKKGKPTNDLIIRYNHKDGVAQDSVTVKDFYKTKKGKSLTSVKHIVTKDGTFHIDPMHESLITYYNIKLGNENKNEVTVGEEDNILEGVYADVTVGDGDENKIHLYKTGSYTGAHVGNGNGNEIIVGGAETMVSTYTNIDVGSGNSNKIITNNSGNSIITIKNGDNNEVYSYGTGYTNINASYGYSYSEEGDTHLGSTYMEVGYNQGETISQTQIQSFGNDTIKGLGQVNVTLQNPTTTTKTFITNFDDRDVTTKSQTNVNIAGNSANINIELQDDIVDNEYTTYFSLVGVPSLGPVSSVYDLVYGAMDENGNIVDGEIFIDDAYVPGGLGGSYIFRFDESRLFIDSNGVCHGLNDEIQLYDMERMNSHDFIHQRDIVYKGGKGLIVNGTAGDDSIIAYGATINAKGGTNSIISGGNDTINVTGTDNILFSSDDISEETGEMVNTYKTINIASGAQASLENILNVGSTTLNYNIDNIYDFVFENAGEYEELDGGDRNYYITLYARDSEGNILNSGERIYGSWDDYGYFDFDNLDADNNLLLDNKLTVTAGNNLYKFENMTHYVDLNNENYGHHFAYDDLPAYDLYLGGGFYVQGSEENDSYYYEWTDVTIKEAGGNDTLNIDTGANFSYFRLFYDVDSEGNVGDDLIIASTGDNNNNFAKMFYLDNDLTDGDDTMSVRNSANVLTIKDYFKTNGGSIENIIAEDSHTDMKLNYNNLIAKTDIEVDTGSGNWYATIVQSVVNWLNDHNDYTSAMDALQNCNDAEALSSLMACYTGNNADTFGKMYWTEA